MCMFSTGESVEKTASETFYIGHCRSRRFVPHAIYLSNTVCVMGQMFPCIFSPQD